MKEEQINKIRNFKQFINESKSSLESEVVSFINKQMLEDKKEYRGHIPTKYNKGSRWNDFTWIVDEIIMFLNKGSSYVLRKFGDRYDYTTLQEIIKNNFKKEYEYVLQNFDDYNKMNKFKDKWDEYESGLDK